MGCDKNENHKHISNDFFVLTGYTHCAMAKTYPSISDDLKQWIVKQPMYFIASAPLQADGHVNLSPRGLDSLRVISDNEVVILDITGSGNETAAHLHENGRMTIMFCSFEKEPKILRLYGQGHVIQTEHPNWSTYLSLFDASLPAIRQIFHLSVKRIQTSCGFGVPLMSFVSQRDTLIRVSEKQGPEGIRKFQLERNTHSIDGLPTPGIGPASDT